MRISIRSLLFYSLITVSCVPWLLWVFYFLSFALSGHGSKPPATSSELFQTNKVWDVTLTFTEDQWKAIEPSPARAPNGQRGFGANRGPGGFDPSTGIASLFFQPGGGDQDKNLTISEWTTLGEKLFQEWSDGKESVSFEVLAERIGKNSPFAPLPASGQRKGLGGLPKMLDFPKVHAAIDFNGRSFDDVEVRYKGNSSYMRSRNSFKRSFKIDLNKFVKGQKIGEISILNLHSNATDPSMMNEVLSHQLYRAAGVPAPRSSYARVFVTVPGIYDKKYFGLYSIIENIDTVFLKDRFQSKDGALFKPSIPDLFYYAGDQWSEYEEAYNAKDAVSAAQSSRVIEFSKLISVASDADFAAHAGSYLDLEKFARYMAVTVWLSTLDSILALGHNYYLYLNPKTQKFEILPWDLDQSFGQFGMGGSDQSSLNIYRPWQGQKRFLERVYALPQFKALYRQELEKITLKLFTPNHIAAQVDQIASAIRTAVVVESAEKAKNFEALAAGDVVARTEEDFPVRMAIVTRKETNTESAQIHEPERRAPGRSVASIKSFAAARAKSVQAQLDGQQTAAPSDRTGPDVAFGGGRQDPMFSRIFTGFDINKDRIINGNEFRDGFGDWFQAWDMDKNNKLSGEEIQSGLRTLLPSAPPLPGGGVP